MKYWDWIGFKDYLPVSGQRSLSSLLDDLEEKEDIDWVVVLMPETEDSSESPEFAVFEREQIIELARDAKAGTLSLPLNVTVDFSASRRGIVVTQVEAQELAAGHHEPNVLPGNAMLVRLGIGGNLTGLAVRLTDEPIPDPLYEVTIEAIDEVFKRHESPFFKDMKWPRSTPGIFERIRNFSLENPIGRDTTDHPQDPGAGSPIKIVLSAHTENTHLVGKTGEIECQVALAHDVGPLSTFVESETSTTDPITVVVTKGSDLFEFTHPNFIVLPFPERGRPSIGRFSIVARSAGATTLGLTFLQNGVELGSLAIDVQVLNATSVPETPSPAFTQMTAATIGSLSTGTVVVLAGIGTGLVATNRGVCFNYLLYSRELEWENVEARSRELEQDRDKLVSEVKVLSNKIMSEVSELLQTDELYEDKLRARARELGRMAFDPGFLDLVWPKRDKINTLRLTSYEKHIPLELALMPSPDGSDIDTKFLCEYGLVRTEPGCSPSQSLRIEAFSYLNATYNGSPYPNIAGFDPDDLSQGPLSSKITFDRIEPTTHALLDALRCADFDVLHITCHGKAHRSVPMKSALVLGDSPGSNGQPVLEKVEPSHVAIGLAGNRKFRDRAPIIFLNACESGKPSQMLSMWTDWAETFLKGGAGAFIGTAWPVRNAPAKAFANALYVALQSGSKLSEASVTARLAAKEAGDASWLAYKVYGDPDARLASLG